jgi:hypothetical protein
MIVNKQKTENNTFDGIIFAGIETSSIEKLLEN